MTDFTPKCGVRSRQMPRTGWTTDPHERPNMLGEERGRILCGGFLWKELGNLLKSGGASARPSLETGFVLLAGLVLGAMTENVKEASQVTEKREIGPSNPFPLPRAPAGPLLLSLCREVI